MIHRSMPKTRMNQDSVLPSINQSQVHQPSIHHGRTPRYTKSRPHNSPLRVMKTVEKCYICKDDVPSAACLNCLTLLCVTCAIAHSKEIQVHSVLELKEAYRKVQDTAQLLEVKLNLIQRSLDAKEHQYDQRTQLNCSLFDEYLNKLQTIRKQVENTVASYFDTMFTSFVQMWNGFVEVWGSGHMLSERISNTLTKLHAFLNYDSIDLISNLAYCFGDMLLEETQQIVDSYERKESVKWSQLKSGSDILSAPRLLLDLSKLNQLDSTLHQLVQLLNWSTEKPTTEIIGSRLSVIPIFPVGCKAVFIYEANTREYEVGEFGALKNAKMPSFIKSIMQDNGDLWIVGGADARGVPLKSVLRFKDGELNTITSIPKARNPANGLAMDGNNLYLIGGIRKEDDRMQWSKSCEMYSITDNTWTTLPDMNYKKPHQTVFRYNRWIFAMGMQLFDFPNIEKLNLDQPSNWVIVQLPSYSLNPFTLGTGYSAVQINDNHVLLFGGKAFSRKSVDEQLNLYTDDDVIKTIYCYDGVLNQFYSLGDKLPGTGVSFGDYTPFVMDGRVLYFETPITKVKKLHRKLGAVNVIEISFGPNGVEAEVVQVLNAE